MATNESLVLGGVELNSLVGDFVIRDGSLSMNPPKKRGEWATGADADGAALVRDPLFENRTIEFNLRVRGQSTTDGALGKIAAVSDKLEEAENQEDGLPLVWTPAGGTKSVTFRVLSGEITELPITRTGDGRGWFRAYPTFHLVLTCKPFGYGTEVVETAVTSSDPVVTATVAGVTGEVPAEGRLIVTDAATQARRHVEWGLEQRHYDASTSLLIDSDSLVISGFSGTQTTRTGAHDPNATGNNVVQASVYTEPTAICGTGNLSHVGTFRVKARVYGAGTGSDAQQFRVRLAWQYGDAQFSANPWALLPTVDAFTEVDLGLITVPAVPLGTQRWTGRIEAYASGEGKPLDVDYLVLVPAGEGYGKARAPYAPGTGALKALDRFTGTTAGGGLDTRAASLGGSWATSGSGGNDFTFRDGPGTGEETIGRSATNDTGYGRAAVLGATSYADIEVGALIQADALPSDSTMEFDVLGRYVDASNWVRALVSPESGRTYLAITSAGTTFAEWYGPPITAGRWYALILVCFASGLAVAQLRVPNGPVVAEISGFDSALATGGALASGKVGVQDFGGSSAGTRYYDSFYATAPGAEPIAIHSGQSLEVRHNDTLREDSTGTYWGRPQSYRGSRFLVPPAGDQNRTSRVLVKARRNDVESAADDQIADSTTVTVAWTPRFIAVPR